MKALKIVKLLLVPIQKFYGILLRLKEHLLSPGSGSIVIVSCDKDGIDLLKFLFLHTRPLLSIEGIVLIKISSPKINKTITLVDLHLTLIRMLGPEKLIEWMSEENKT